jgi:hypothetical protein
LLAGFLSKHDLPLLNSIQPNQNFTPSNQNFTPPHQNFTPSTQNFTPTNHNFTPTNYKLTQLACIQSCNLAILLTCMIIG